MAHETFTFQTEVTRLLEIVAHSLYSHKEIFLRELVSNASDACDRLRYAAITDANLTADDPDLKIRISVDKDARTITVADNGIGMNHGDLIDSLGTIARSGTQGFLSQLSGDQRKDVSLIGQFGVGFYSAFMVAERVEVFSRKAGEDAAWRWESDGLGTFTIDEASREGRGTSVVLHVREGEDSFLDPSAIRRVVRTYSDHVGFPIVLSTGDKEETLNTASALWSRPKSEITDEQYKEFYHHVGHAFDEPWHRMHNSVEGVVSYSSLLFIPSVAPFDLFHPERKGHVKLYVKRVFITDDCEGLLPSYLRFLTGVVDSEDLPLNISRETFQHDPRLAKIKSGLVKRVLDELAKKADSDPEAYGAFWNNFGAVLKEGIYEDYGNRERLLELSRFRSTAGDDLVSLGEYVARMKEGQTAIYTLSGETIEAVRRSPQLEGFRAKGVEVLLLTDPIDEFWIPTVGAFKDTPFKSVAAAGADLSGLKSEAGDAEDDESSSKPGSSGDLDPLVAVLKLALGDLVKDVRVSERLTDSAVCLVAADGDMDMHLERMLRQHRQLQPGMATPRILEINPKHPVIRRLAERAADIDVSDAAHLLLDQARIVEGESVIDPAAFARRLSNIMASGLMAPAPAAQQTSAT